MKTTSRLLLSAMFLLVQAAPALAQMSFQDKCDQSGVLVCEGFDSQEAIDAVFEGLDIHVPAVYDEADSAAKMTVPSESPANNAGSFFFNFSATVSRTDPGEQHIWFQYRVKYPQEMLDYPFLITGSTNRTRFKASVMWGGGASCSSHQLVIMPGGADHHIFAYTRCGAVGLGEERSSFTDFQPGGDTTCIYRHINPRECLLQVGDTWTTYTGHVNLDSYRMELWVKHGNDPHLYKALDTIMPSQPEDLFYNHIYLSPYMTSKDSTQVHPVFNIWYDDLIVSTSPIELPAGQPVFPPAPGGSLDRATLVDFGATEAANTYGTELTQPFKDHYERYTGDGGGGIAAAGSAAYNHSGVTGGVRQFSAGDRVIATFFNRTSADIVMEPMLNFSSSSRYADSNQWHVMPETTVPAGATATSYYILSSVSADSYSFVNVANYSDGIVVDKIEHEFATSTSEALPGRPKNMSVVGD